MLLPYRWNFFLVKTIIIASTGDDILWREENVYLNYEFENVVQKSTNSY